MYTKPTNTLGVALSFSMASFCMASSYVLSLWVASFSMPFMLRGMLVAHSTWDTTSPSPFI